MKRVQLVLIFGFLLLLLSCQKNHKIVSIEIGEQKHIVGQHYDSDMTMCLEDEIGSSGFSFTMYVETKDGRNFECSKDIQVVGSYGPNAFDKCIDFTTRPFFNVRGATDEDYTNMKSMRKGNIETIKIVIWDDSFENAVAEETFANL